MLNYRKQNSRYGRLVAKQPNFDPSCRSIVEASVLERKRPHYFLRSTEVYVASTVRLALPRHRLFPFSHYRTALDLDLHLLALFLSLSLSFQVVLLGDTNTGKTSLVLRFVEGYYRDAGRSSTVGAFFLTKRLTASNITCKLLLWDTAGQEQFQKLAVTYYRHAAAAILSYDVTNPRSLVRLRAWLDDLQRHTGIVPVPNKNNSLSNGNNGGGGVGGVSGSGGGSSHHPIGLAGRRQMVLAVVACKSDLPASPGLQEEAARLAASMGAIYIETSAKENINVGELFHALSEQVLQTYQDSIAAGIVEPAIPVTVHGGAVSHASPTSGGAGSRPSTHTASMSPGETHAFDSTGQAQRSSIASPKNASTNSKSSAPLSPMFQDEKKDDDLLNESGFSYNDDKGDSGSIGPNRITCDGIAGNILTCGATETGRSCVIL
jgi:GTPase SAR1 family protein